MSKSRHNPGRGTTGIMNEAELRSRAGRKRDPGRDGVIPDAALTVLAEHGYDGMTIDMVAARAGSARATVYRRWATKDELVLAAVERMSRDDVNLDQLPDTGSLRGDIVAMILPLSEEEQQVRIQAMAALLALSQTDSRLAEAATGAEIGPWIEVNRILIQRAVDRGEFPPPGDLDTFAELIPMMCVSRAVQQLPITREFSLALVDGVIIPALRGGP
ncbi:MAG TPA: TetR/AcrR family transcriptional regulator [Solirubrobacteraceae bacterium]|jgi:AcrR family transcriptional regulator|nr:TetR/AcrR family transcriptional regulator [Solirubrobacteraceae bacterium]